MTYHFRIEIPYYREVQYIKNRYVRREARYSHNKEKWY